MLEESDCKYRDSYVADDENYIPPANFDINTADDSDIELEVIIEQEEEYSSDESVEDEPVSHKTNSSWIAKDETEWSSNALPSAQTIFGNISRQRGMSAATSNLFTSEELFKSIMRTEICDVTLRETNRKGKKVSNAFNNNLLSRFPYSSGRPPSKTFQPFTEAELHAFIGILIAAGVHRQNNENLYDIWKVNSLPLVRAAMSRNRFKMMLRFIRFDNESTRAERKYPRRSTNKLWS